MSRNRIRSRRSVVAACLAAVLAGAVGTAGAQQGAGAGALELERRDRDAGARAVQQGPVSLEEAIELAQRRFGGQVVRAETRTVNGREVHVIRIIQDGTRVRTVQIDAATGRLRR